MANYELPPLPYDYDALEPHISEQVLTWHLFADVWFQRVVIVRKRWKFVVCRSSGLHLN